MNGLRYRATILVAVGVSMILPVRHAAAERMQRNVLSKEDVAALVTQVPGQRDGETVNFMATFGPQENLNRRDRARHVAAGTIPFRITADYVLLRTADNRTLRQRLPGTVHVYVMDAEGNIVANESMQVERMCPT